MQQSPGSREQTNEASHRYAVVLCTCCILGIVLGYPLATGLLSAGQSGADATLASPPNGTPSIPAMLLEVNASEMERTALDLQNFSTRAMGTAGNEATAVYLSTRLSEYPNLIVEYQGGDLQNVIATLPGGDPGSNVSYLVGAHYDSTSSDPDYAPGVTDNGCGVAIVLELSRVMSLYRFNQTVRFAFWNAEEIGLRGSTRYVEEAQRTNLTIPLYLNYDSACYDPENRSVLDIMFANGSEDAALLMAENNALYGIGFNLTSNAHTCTSDHTPFQDAGYPALMTHAETHGPAHSVLDTIDAASFSYAQKNAQLGLSVLAMRAGVLGVSNATSSA